MKQDTQEKSLIQINENSVFYKIKRFLVNLFHKHELQDMPSQVTNNLSSELGNQRNTFIESLKNVENEETKLLKLQKQYSCGEIKEEDLTPEQIKSLCNLYKKQNEELRKSNEIKKQKIAQYKKANKLI